MHRPEFVFALGRGLLGRFGGMFRVRVAGADREVAEHEAQSVAHLPLEFLHNRVGLPTVGALVVAVLHQRHRGVRGGSLRVVARPPQPGG